MSEYPPASNVTYFDHSTVDNPQLQIFSAAKLKKVNYVVLKWQ